MTIREAIKEQQKSIKNRSLKEQFSFFWEYYGLKTISLILAVAIAISFIVSMVTQKTYGFTGVFFGAEAQVSSDHFLEDFGQTAGIDLSKYELSVQCRPAIYMDQQITPEVYQSMEAFTAMVAAKSVDCFAGNTELFLYFAYMEYAIDLRTVFAPEELSRLSPYLHYIDGKLIQEQEAAGDGLASAYARHPDSTKPEQMTDPIPVGISLDAANEEFKNTYRFGETAVIGICVNSEQTQNALAFLRYCLN